MSDKPTPIVLGLMVSTKTQFDFFTVTARFVKVIKDDNGRERIRNVSSYPWEKVPFVDDLVLTAQGEIAQRAKGLYAFSATVEPHSLDLAKATRAVKVLTTVERGLSKLYDTRGNVATFGEYVSRVAEVLKVKHYIVEDTGRGNTGWAYDDHSYTLRPVGTIRNALEHIERQWKEEAQPAALSA